MSAQFITIHPVTPQPRLLAQVADHLRSGGVAVCPTDSAYALCCLLERPGALERIARIREVSRTHNFTLLCRDLSELSNYARFDNQIFRLLKNNTPGPYTFILPATKEVPRRMMNEKRRTIGIRVPANTIVRSLVETLGEPLMSCTLWLPGDDLPLADPQEIRERLEKLVDVIVDGGVVPPEPTTVIRFEDSTPVVRRVGAGDPAPFTTA